MMNIDMDLVEQKKLVEEIICQREEFEHDLMVLAECDHCKENFYASKEDYINSMKGGKLYCTYCIEEYELLPQFDDEEGDW